MILLIRKEAASLDQEVQVAEAAEMIVTEIANIRVADHIHDLTVDADIRDTGVISLGQEIEGVIEIGKEKEEDQDHLETGIGEIEIGIDMKDMIGNIEKEIIENIGTIPSQILEDQEKKRRILVRK